MADRQMKTALRQGLRRHGLSMRKEATLVALECLAKLQSAKGVDAEDACDAFLEIIEDEGVTSCLVDEHTVAAAVKKLDVAGPASEGAEPAAGPLVYRLLPLARLPRLLLQERADARLRARRPL